MEIKMQHKADLDARSVKRILSNFWVANVNHKPADKQKTVKWQEAGLCIMLYNTELQIFT